MYDCVISNARATAAELLGTCPGRHLPRKRIVASDAANVNK
jgi:hypothetical protein